MIRNILPNKSGNRESYKKIIIAVEKFFNVLTGGEDLLRTFFKLFYLGFMFQVISERTPCRKDYTV